MSLIKENKSSHQISRTLLSIPVDLNNAVVEMISILLLISNSASLFSKPLGTVSNIASTIGISVTLMFNNILFSS